MNFMKPFKNHPFFFYIGFVAVSALLLGPFSTTLYESFMIFVGFFSALFAGIIFGYKQWGEK